MKNPNFLLLLPIFILLNACSGKQAFSKQAIKEKIPLETYVGKWYINMSSFPMWLKGNKTNPTFNYSLETKDEVKGLHGNVQYLKKGKPKSIEGFDKPENEYNTSFLWRGQGILRAFKSRWEIIAYDPENKWAIMHFEKTGFTPEGYDLFSRQKQPDTNTLKEMQKKLKELGLEGKLTAIKQE